MLPFPSHHWGVILGGSSGFGLATAQRLGELGDRKSTRLNSSHLA